MGLLRGLAVAGSGLLVAWAGAGGISSMGSSGSSIKSGGLAGGTAAPPKPTPPLSKKNDTAGSNSQPWASNKCSAIVSFVPVKLTNVLRASSRSIMINLRDNRSGPHFGTAA
jgi:hypothetical protein